MDRSLNEQLILNNSSFEVNANQSRSRSFAKTGALSSQQNSRDVIMAPKKKTIGQHQSSQPQTIAGSKSSQQSKQKGNKEMLNYLN